MTREQVISDFEKQVNHLNNSDVQKIIPNMESKALIKLTKHKKQQGAFVVIDKNSNYVLMFFYHANNGMRAAQYIVGKDILPDGALVLCGLFSEYMIKILAKLKIPNKQNIFSLAGFYNKQIQGHKEFLKQPKQ